MTSPKTRKALAARFGVPFPDDLFAFDELWRSKPKLFEALEIGRLGPLEVLEGSEEPSERFYNDPPEMITMLSGHTDGLHWGYWFDHPGEQEPVVVSFYSNDAFEIGVDGATLFEAMREHLEMFHRDAEDYARDDPGSADAYREQLEELATDRDALSKHSALLKKRSETGTRYLDKYVFTVKPKTHRKPVATTRSKIGIVVDKKRYRPLAKKDPFEVWDYSPKATEVARFVAAASQSAADGFPGAALKLGHDLWIYKDHHPASHQMLELAYSALGREALLPKLKAAVDYRRACDLRRKST